MGEKRGHTVKIQFDFNTAGVLEVQTVSDKWYRVTAERFRCFDGPRRITEPTTVELGVVQVPVATQEYYGPVYKMGTNKMLPFTNSRKFEE